jgi:hypothetical protein
MALTGSALLIKDREHGVLLIGSPGEKIVLSTPEEKIR